LREPQVLYRVSNLAILNPEHAIAGHACYHTAARVNLPGLPEARNVQPAPGGLDHFFQIGFTWGHEQV
jgi:hypothetical protein